MPASPLPALKFPFAMKPNIRKTSIMKPCVRPIHAIVAISCVSAAIARAADLYYDSQPSTAAIDGGAGNWADANWKAAPEDTSGLYLSAADHAFLNPVNGSPAPTTVTLVGGQTASAVSFNGAGYALTGGILSLSDTGATNWIHMNADGVIASALGTMRFKGAGEAIISGGGTISGRAVLGDGGSERVTVRQTDGAVTVNDYFMVGGNNVANSQGRYIMDGGSLSIAKGIYLGWGGADRTGTFIQNGGTVTTNDANQGIQLGIGGGKGHYELNGGTLVSNFGQYGAPYSGTFTFGGGTLRAATSFDTKRQTGVATTIADGATARIDTSGQSVIWSEALTGAMAAGLVKSGDGLLVLSGANAYAGDTEAARGIIRAGHANAFGNTTGTIRMTGMTSSSGAIDLNGFSFDNPVALGFRAVGPGADGVLLNTNTSSVSVLNGDVALGGENYLGGNGSVVLKGVVSGGAVSSYSMFKQGQGTWSFANENNTFDGFYYQIGGTTEVTRLAGLNESSSLGMPTTGAANRFLFGFSGNGGGVLRFVGASASRSDRNFVLQGATDGASNTIEASGTDVSATLTLDGSIASGRGGAYTLAIGGENAGANEISGEIADGAGSVALNKLGEGRWILSGTNSYSGATTVSAGTLLVTGALGDSAVTVASGATLGGTGTIGGSLTFEAGARLDLTGAELGLSSTHVLSVAEGGAITLTNFSFSDLVGWDWAHAAVGTYTLIHGGDATLGGLTPTAATPQDFGNGRSGYFQAGSLQAVIIPEPTAALLSLAGCLTLLRRRRWQSRQFSKF